MKRCQIYLLVVVLVGLLAALSVYVFIYNKPHRNYETATPDYILSTKSLFNNYKDDKLKAQKTYNGKVLQINGNLKKIEDRDSVVVAIFVFQEGDFGDEGIRCAMLPKFNSELRHLKPDDFLTIKGYCTGYNGTDVILEKCSLVE
jgi:hypothetical protein